MKKHLKLTVAYDGSNYNGFQRQKNGIGVQQILEKGLTKLFREEITIVASGRTDAKVHARRQVISFATTGKVPTSKIVQAMVSYLPKDIVVLAAEEVSKQFNARYCAVRKRYEYRLLYTKINNPFQRDFRWQIKKEPDLLLLQEVAKVIVGEHDFAAFRSAGSSAQTTVRTIYKADWIRHKNEYIFTIEGNGFLYKMVRNIVGAMMKVGWSEITVEDFKLILAARDRRLAGKAAPPQGLFLDEVFYK
ncbi:MAG TPA: tRNA pseudouridine(38-40) synthase TruA [Candidatus Avacidaminococcus intestinavium]|uniref:tRNA pseudouridine synthase A n=1 Tax=Candidatus Avacidaminococcus intestinavium TaxID=2840684 RepID=A0A9D1MNZ3_9FIRM|nr:tRNA pseudouridine(38-40) synthase TruA [Candidatus Avacidaminococcus intestinavium]